MTDKAQPSTRAACCAPQTAPEADVRDTVSVAYTEALRKSKAGKGGCCSGALPSSEPAFSTAAKMAGYGEERDAYADTASSSFGCGNPLAFAGVQPGQTVFDLGSGAGLDLLLAADKVGPTGKVIGIDMTDDMIEAGRAAAKAAGHEQIEIRKGFIEALPVEAGSVDWVISNCVINLSPNKPKVFAEIARVLKPGGQFSVSDIVASELPSRVKDNAAAYSACIGGAISEDEYVAGLREAGLVDVKVTERLVYEAEQLRGMVETDLEALGVDPKLLESGLDAAVGKVWSAKIVGAKGA